MHFEMHNIMPFKMHKIIYFLRKQNFQTHNPKHIIIFLFGMMIISVSMGVIVSMVISVHLPLTK